MESGFAKEIWRKYLKTSEPGRFEGNWFGKKILTVPVAKNH
jgi:hypothetical protein